MKIQDLIKQWQEHASDPRTAQAYSIHLPLYDAARVAALSELYPGRTAEQIITELLNVILDEVEEAFPYVQGDKVVGEDECGDPLYEDVGPTPRFLEATKRHLSGLEKELEASE